MVHSSANPALQIGYLMQTGAAELSIPSGPQLHVMAVIEGLQTLGHQVNIMAFQQGNLGWSADGQRWSAPRYGFTQSVGFRYLESAVRRTQTELRLPFWGCFDSLRYADACIQHFRGFDLFYERFGYMGYGGVLAARRLGIPLFLELNGNVVQEIDEMGWQMSPTQRRLGRWLAQRTLQAADHIIVVSEALKQQLLVTPGLPAAKISVVLNGVHLERFEAAYDPAQVRQAYQLPSHPTVTFVGSFKPWHGVELLVDAFQLLHARVPTAQLLLVGDGEGRDAVTQQIAALGLTTQVKLLGRLAQQQVAEILSVSDVVVAPYPFQHSDITGTPLKLIEYMAAGKAIVASTAPLHEVIAHEVTGIRVAPASAPALADGIVRLLADTGLRRQLGANAQREAQQYSWRSVVERLNRLFWVELARRKQRANVFSTVQAEERL